MEDITLLSVLTEAKETAERVERAEARLAARYRVARVIRDAGQEASFGSYVADALAEFEARWRASSNPERQAESDELNRLEAEAKRLLLSGETAEAEDVFLSAEGLRPDHEARGALGARFTLLQWLLDAGDLAGALGFAKAADWLQPSSRLTAAQMVAKACIAAGQRVAGLRFLFEMWPDANDPKAYPLLAQFGRHLWDLGIEQQALGILRQAAMGSLAAAARDVRLPLMGYLGQPLGVASAQLKCGDRQGAAETLRGVLRLAAPVEYDPPEPRPPDLPPQTLWLSGAKLKPAARRWLEARDELARLLACAGLDSEAFALLDTPAAKPLQILENIGHGQCERGAIAAAFTTAERILSGTLSTEAEPSSVIITPDGRISFHVQSGPTRPVEELERKAACRKVAFWICMTAAKLGDMDAFCRAEALGRQAAPAEWHIQIARFFNGEGLRNLARAGQRHAAVSLARRLEDPDVRTSALLRVAEGIAGIGDRWDG